MAYRGFSGLRPGSDGMCIARIGFVVALLCVVPVLLKVLEIYFSKEYVLNAAGKFMLFCCLGTIASNLFALFMSCQDNATFTSLTHVVVVGLVLHASCIPIVFFFGLIVNHNATVYQGFFSWAFGVISYLTILFGCPGTEGPSPSQLLAAPLSDHPQILTQTQPQRTELQ